MGSNKFSQIILIKLGLLSFHLFTELFEDATTQFRILLFIAGDDYSCLRRKLQQTQEENDKLKKLLGHQTETGIVIFFKIHFHFEVLSRYSIQAYIGLFNH